MTALPLSVVPSAVPGTVRVTIAVPTYRRTAELSRLLPLLLEHARAVSEPSGSRFTADVLVVDNDPQGSAADVVAAVPGVRYVAEPTPGIAAVRNRAMDEAADARVLAFLDDDERPQPGWLASLLDTWAASGAAAVAGRVVAEFGAEPEPWLRAGNLFARRSMPTGTEVDVAAAGNLLLDLGRVRALGIRFEPALALGGGEDNLFTRSLVRAGGRIVWCDESVAVDPVPPERMTRRWLRARAWSQGNSTVTTDLHLTAGSWRRRGLRAAYAQRGAVRVAAGLLQWGWGALRRDDRHRARGWWTAIRGAGMVGGACGVVYEEYARTGRRWRLARGERR
jgi:hypothetical protein